MLLTQQQVNVGLNFVMAFSTLTFTPKWTRTYNVCYTLSFHYRVYIVEYRLSYKLSIWACSWAETKSFLFLASVPLVLAVAIHFHHQCFLFLSRTDREELSLSIWSDVVFFSLAYFIAILSLRSATAAMITSLLLRAYSPQFCLLPLTQSSMLTTPLLPSRLGTTAQSLISDVAHHTWW